MEKNGKRLPEKGDAFTITTQVQKREGWHISAWRPQENGVAEDSEDQIPGLAEAFSHDGAGADAPYLLRSPPRLQSFAD